MLIDSAILDVADLSRCCRVQDISDIYHLSARTRGVFTNIALQEPFGLTLIEAAVHGVPIVATKHGGPVDIIHTLKVRCIFLFFLASLVFWGLFFFFCPALQLLHELQYASNREHACHNR